MQVFSQWCFLVNFVEIFAWLHQLKNKWKVRLWCTLQAWRKIYPNNFVCKLKFYTSISCFGRDGFKNPSLFFSMITWRSASYTISFLNILLFVPIAGRPLKTAFFLPWILVGEFPMALPRGKRILLLSEVITFSLLFNIKGKYFWLCRIEHRK